MRFTPGVVLRLRHTPGVYYLRKRLNQLLQVLSRLDCAHKQQVAVRQTVLVLDLAEKLFIKSRFCRGQKPSSYPLINHLNLLLIPS